MTVIRAQNSLPASGKYELTHSHIRDAALQSQEIATTVTPAAIPEISIRPILHDVQRTEVLNCRLLTKIAQPNLRDDTREIVLIFNIGINDKRIGINDIVKR